MSLSPLALPPGTGRLKQHKFYFLTALEARNPRAGAVLPDIMKGHIKACPWLLSPTGMLLFIHYVFCYCYLNELRQLTQSQRPFSLTMYNLFDNQGLISQNFTLVMKLIKTLKDPLLGPVEGLLGKGASSIPGTHTVEVEGDK